MKNKKRNVLIITIIGIAGFMIYDFFSIQLHELNGEGKLIDSSVSPKKQYVAKSFLINNGGATVASQVRVSITSSEDNTKEDFDDETVYWGYRESEADIKWLNDNTLTINGKKINILKKETYFHWREHL